MWTVLCACVNLILPISVLGDTGFFWHVTDFHYDTTYHDRQLSCNSAQKPENLGDYGDFWCDSPWLLVNSSIQAMVNIQSDVDFILWTGDSVLHGHDDDLNYTVNAGILSDITNELNLTFPNVPTYASFGNHDYWPNNQFPPSNNQLYNDSLDRWGQWIKDTAQHNNFRKGAYYTVKTSYLRIIVLNTNLYYTSNKAVLNESDPADQLAWLNSTLQQARQANEKVLITAHIGPGIHTPNSIYWMHEVYHNPLLDILQTHADIIVGMHFGHDHADGFKVLPDKSGTPRAPIFIAPSVTPWRYIIPNEIGPAHNPGVRLVQYDRQTGRHLEINQYYLNLTEANTLGMADWKSLYNFTKSYNIDDLAADSLAKLVQRMKEQNGPEMALFWKFYTVNPPAELMPKCDDNCHRAILCGYTNFKMADFRMCEKQLISSAPRSISSSYVTLTFTLAGFIAILNAL